MSTKTQQTSTLAFDPTSMSTYQGLQGQLGSMVSSYLSNPFSNPFFQTQSQMGTNQANSLGQTGISNATRNWNMSGLSTTNPAFLEMLQNQGRANTNLRANLGFLNPVQNAFTAQQNAAGLASQYRPLQTGGTQTQTQSGLGTWLPQLVGAGLGIAGGAITGGLGGAATSAGLGASNLLTGTFQNAQSPGMAGLNMSPTGTYNFGSLQPPSGYNTPQSPFMYPAP